MNKEADKTTALPPMFCGECWLHNDSLTCTDPEGHFSADSPNDKSPSMTTARKEEEQLGLFD